VRSERATLPQHKPPSTTTAPTGTNSTHFDVDGQDGIYHSKYNPVERCWGILEQHWNGAQLRDADTMLQWAKSMTWKGVHPVVEMTRKVYAKGVKLTTTAMREVEARLSRNPQLPKWDILITPACAV